MASSSKHLLLLLLATTLIIQRASSHDDGGAGKAVYTKVCDESRFEAAGLVMSRYPYCNASIPYADRVHDLIGWMTVEEKVSNLGDWADGAPRIGLPPYMWWSEALHGLSSTGPTTKFDDPKKPRLHSGRAAVFNGTVFANVINSAASFNETLWMSIGQVRTVRHMSRMSVPRRKLFNALTNLLLWQWCFVRRSRRRLARCTTWGRAG
jgi:hypothetical protein